MEASEEMVKSAIGGTIGLPCGVCRVVTHHDRSIWPMVSNPPGRCNSPISEERLSEEFAVDGSEVGQTIRLGDMPRQVLGPETNGE